MPHLDLNFNYRQPHKIPYIIRESAVVAQLVEQLIRNQ